MIENRLMNLEGGFFRERRATHSRVRQLLRGVFGIRPLFFRFNSKQQALYILDRPGSRGQLRAQM